MEYMKQKIEGTEDYNVICIGENEMITYMDNGQEVTESKYDHYTRNGYEPATEDEYNAQFPKEETTNDVGEVTA